MNGILPEVKVVIHIIVLGTTIVHSTVSAGGDEPLVIVVVSATCATK